MPNEPLPSIDFTTLVLSLSQTAFVHLGQAPHPDQKDAPPPRNLALARQTIDLLGVLQEKTKGNLTGEEERLMEHVLYDLRLQYVEASKAEGSKEKK